MPSKDLWKDIALIGWALATIIIACEIFMPMPMADFWASIRHFFGLP